MKIHIPTLIAVLLPCAALAEVAVIDPWARASILASRPAAAYLTMTSDQADRLIAASSPAAKHIMIHATERDPEGAVRMRHLEFLDLVPGNPVTLAPGGIHLMLTGLSGPLLQGGRFPLTLRYEIAGEVTIEVPVLGMAAAGPEDTR